MAIDIAIYRWSINITRNTERFLEFMKFIHCQSTERVYILCKHFISWFSIFTGHSGKKTLSVFISQDIHEYYVRDEDVTIKLLLALSIQSLWPLSLGLLGVFPTFELREHFYKVNKNKQTSNLPFTLLK